MHSSFQKIIDFDKHLKTYVRKCVLPQQNLEGHHFQLVIPETGVQNLVRILRIEDAAEDVADFIIRILPRSQYATAEQLRAAHHMLTDYQVPHAPILGVDHRVNRGHYIAILEKFIHGKTPREQLPSREQAAGFGKALGRLHGQTRTDWGALTGKGKIPESYFRKDLLRRANNRLRSIRRFKERPALPEEIKTIVEWFGRKIRELPVPQLFSLRHGKLYPSNIIMDSKNDLTLTLIDYGSLAYGSAAEDLQMVRWRTLGNQPDLDDAFMTEWRATTLPKVAEETERHNFLFLAYYHLREAAIRFKRSRSRLNQEASLNHNLQQFQQQWDLLRKVLESNP